MTTASSEVIWLRQLIHEIRSLPIASYSTPCWQYQCYTNKQPSFSQADQAYLSYTVISFDIMFFLALYSFEMFPLQIS